MAKLHTRLEASGDRTKRSVLYILAKPKLTLHDKQRKGQSNSIANSLRPVDTRECRCLRASLVKHKGISEPRQQTLVQEWSRRIKGIYGELSLGLFKSENDATYQPLA